MFIRERRAIQLNEEFYVDKPFIVCLIDRASKNEGAILLFCGKMTNPGNTARVEENKIHEEL